MATSEPTLNAATGEGYAPVKTNYTVADLTDALARLDPNAPLRLAVEECGSVVGAVTEVYVHDDGTVELGMY